VSGEGSGFSLNEIDLSASMNARADGLGYGQMPLVSPLSVDSSIRLAGGLLSIERASVRGPGTEVDANGTYRLKPRIVHGEADVRLGPLRQLQLLQGKRELQGMFQISMQVYGPVKNPEASIDVRGEELRYGDFPAGDSPAGNFQMSASLTGGNLVISEMDMSTGEASAAVSGSIGLIESDEVEDEDRAEDNEQSMRESFPLDLEVAARGFTLDRYIDAVPVQGLAAVDAQVKGTVQNPEVRAELVLDGIRYSDFAAGSGTLEVGFSNGVLRIEDGYLARGDSRVSFQGTTRLLAGKGRQQDRTSGPPQDLTGEENGLPAFDLLVRGEDLSIGDYLPDPGKREGDPGMSGIAGVSGRISVSAHLEGTASQPDLSVQVRGRDLSAVQNVEMFSARIGYQDKTLRLHELAADLNGSEPEGEVYASGWYRPGAAFEIEAGSPGIPLADLQPLAAVSAAENTEEVRDREDAEHEKGTESAKDTKSAEYEKAAESAEALPGTAPAGLLKFDIQGSGTVSDPRIQGSVTVADFSAGGTRLGDHRLNVAMRDRNINVNGNVGFPVRASYGLDSKSFSLEARLENTSFTPYLSLAGVQDFGGRITGTVSAQGNLSDMETVQGSVYLSYLMVTSGQERIAQTSDIRVVLEDGRFTMDPFRVYFPVLRLPGEGEKQAILAVQGAGELGGELDISVQGSFPAELAGRFTEQLANPVGRVNLQARVGGTIENPVLQGSLNIRGLGFAVTATGQQFYGIRGDVHMTPETVNVQKLTGRLDEGSFTLSGTLEYDTEGPGPVSMDISTVALPVRVPGTADLVLNLDLNFSGVPDETLAAGEVAILEGVFFGELGLKQVDEKLAQTPGSVRPEPDIPYLREVQLDVDVLTRSPFVVDHNLALLYLSPEVRVYGTFEEPLVNGRVNIDSGAFVLRGTEFEVTRGSVTFTDPYRINPYIEVEAETEIRQYNIMLRAVGPPDDLNLSLRSVPSLPDEDILSLILIGRTAGELARGEGEQLTPDQMLARVAGSLLSDQVGELVGLDVLEVEFPDVQEEEQETGVRVTLGVELSKRLDLEHSLQSTEEGLVQRTSAEYKLLDRVLIRVFQNTLGAFGGELQYRVDFR
jgi:autotransporter translocation and assembly factor TamB